MPVETDREKQLEQKVARLNWQNPRTTALPVAHSYKLFAVLSGNSLAQNPDTLPSIFSALGSPKSAKAMNISRVFCIVLSVGYPNFHTRNVHRRIHNRQGSHRLIVMLAKVMRNKKVPVLFVIISMHIEFLRLRTSRNCNLLALTTRLRSNRIYRQFPKRNCRFHPKQSLRTLNQATYSTACSRYLLRLFE
jgi:hypothetical protein